MPRLRLVDLRAVDRNKAPLRRLRHRVWRQGRTSTATSRGGFNMRGGMMKEGYPVSATTGISFDDYAKMRVARHAMRQAKTVPEFAANDSMFRRVILQKCWQYCRRVPMPEGTKLSDIDAVATKKALNAGFGFEATSPNHQDRVMRHAEVIRRCGGYASFCSAIAYRAWRMRWDSTYIAEEMQLEPEHVRQTLSRLVAIADAL